MQTYEIDLVFIKCRLRVEPSRRHEVQVGNVSADSGSITTRGLGVGIPMAVCLAV